MEGRWEVNTKPVIIGPMMVAISVLSKHMYRHDPCNGVVGMLTARYAGYAVITRPPGHIEG